MRQKDDLEFSELLNRLRVNQATDVDMARLKLCEISVCSPLYDINAPHLFAKNFLMHSFNDSLISKMATEKVIISSFTSVVSPKLTRDKQENATRTLPNDPNKSSNLHSSLTVVVYMIYDLTVNIHT
ncbi:hypothetical protein DPMN_016138 [Dreissena polymorpha]|uniref:Uncharacterized protein n=1 Tax=Dreissena polymorpha TaxID=45954 RepID=A0A9D4N944_DREPO|nr:hypothetical protein DPMN_016138 [Dreissena polymorpha]